MNAKFYVDAGELIRHFHSEQERQGKNGNWYTAFVVRSEYVNGWAEYDGARWEGKVYRGEGE